MATYAEKTADKRSSGEWLREPKYSNIAIIDPDGWDRKNFEQSWNEPITEIEFTARE